MPPIDASEVMYESIKNNSIKFMYQFTDNLPVQ